MNRKDRIRKKKRALRVRGSQHRGLFPRVSVFRSLNNIYGQIIDDQKHETLASFSSAMMENPQGDKKTIAHAVGKELAARAQKKGITQVIFDRGSYLYHGRVDAFAQGLREGGMTV